MTNRLGTSLTEMLLVLSILGICIALAATPARSGLDALRVRSAREAVFGMATRTRALAIARGGADLVIDLHAATATVVDASGAIADRMTLAPARIGIAVDGSAPARVILRYDGIGIGRMASRTVRFTKGSAEAGLTFSSYGRIRRW